MNFADYYQRIINWPGRTAEWIALVTAVAFVIMAAVILSMGMFRRFARILGIIGVVLIVALLWIVREQTTTVKKGKYITVTTHRYSDRTRLALLVGLVTLPVVATVVMSSVFVTTRRRLRALVPRRLKAGRRHQAEKKFQAALREYNEAIQTSPQLAEAYFRRGSLYLTMGERALAMADFGRAIDRDRRFAPAYLQRGKMCLENGDYDSALADYGMLMTIRANDPETHLGRGICLVKKGLLSEAAADFQRVLKLTNHSDFAEPAKHYLRECESPAPKSLPAAGSNGSASASPSSEPSAPEFMI
jgi:tetratricopeptide (TPR) repeat protein